MAGEEMAILSVPEVSALTPAADILAVSLDFKVLHPVVITQLGVFTNSPRQEFRGNVTIRLFQVDQEVGATERRNERTETFLVGLKVWFMNSQRSQRRHRFILTWFERDRYLHSISCF